MSVCEAAFNFFMQPWIIPAAKVAMILIAVFLVIMLVGWWRQEAKWAKEALDAEKIKSRELLAKVNLSSSTRRVHMEKSVKPALSKLLTAIKKSKPGIVPSDQANAFLKTLIALWGDEILLAEVYSVLMQSKHMACKKGVAHTYFQFWWSAQGLHNATFFINWEGLSTPFSLTIWF
jgi:hypothetical protein